MLGALRAGYTLAEFEHVLGTPLFSRPAAPTLTEYIFQGRGYWAQVITGRSATVVLYAVTSCSTNFTPSFHLPIPSRNGKGSATVTLNRTRFTEVLTSQEEERVHVDYNTGASADQWYLDKYYGANPGFYKSYAWGLNDACPDWFPFFSKLEREGLTPGPGRLNYQGPVMAGGSRVARFRSHVPVNTYAESSVSPTSGGYGFPHLNRGLHIGADRILIRTATLH
ncbi:MAG TPA: ETEC_3214 domain-containing protein [Solirubrobacteraceae bacterium]|nr:ETEC_3214 domain-containing protein [Solirubrobacteraceae bacterium]